MGSPLFQVLDHAAKMEQFARGILSHAADIKKIQAEHAHIWSFSFQINAHHERLWHVHYQCNGCGVHRREDKEPVCEACDTPLVRCSAEDTEAEAERQKPEYGGRMNIPLAFRCPKDQKIHILWHRGD